MSKLLNVVTACVLLCQLTGWAQTSEKKEPSVPSGVSAVPSEIVVPPGSEAHDPIVQAARDEATAARAAWDADLRAFLRAISEGGPEEMAAAEAEFIRQNFETYVLVLEKEAKARGAISDWTKRHRVETPGLDELKETTDAMMSGASKEEKRAIGAYHRAAKQLLELESTAADNHSNAKK